MDEEEEVEGGNDECEETKIECQKNIKQMLVEAFIISKEFLQGSFSPKIYSLI